MALKSLIECGSKLWLDSIDPDYLRQNLAWGATGATSNPIIITDLINSSRFDRDLDGLIDQGLNDEEIAWQLTDQLVGQAQQQLISIWQATNGNDGYVSFELDPLWEGLELGLSHTERVSRYIEQGCRWSAGHENRMIKVPATPAGLDCLEELVGSGVTVNVTLIFTDRQYTAARDAVWRGAQKRDDLNGFKSVYSIFVSRVDVYTEKHVPQLSAAAQGQVGIVNAKRIWAENQRFWSDLETPLEQEIIFASTGTKNPEDPPWKYVQAFAGSDILTNPPATNEAVAESSLTFTRRVDQLPEPAVLAEIDEQVDFAHLEQTLMDEGMKKFADPQKALLALIAKKRAALASSP
ncbi:MAG: transaldolase [Planctomycetes bacterium]|nr:transaldolase [Planctomycetota bacterium]